MFHSIEPDRPTWQTPRSPRRSMTVTLETVELGGRPIAVTLVFDTYWRFAAARQHIYEARQAGRPGPWTTDPILRQHRFTNCSRAADRFSQFLISEVAYRGPQDPADIVFRILLFKFFNKVSTWRLLERHFSEIS